MKRIWMKLSLFAATLVAINAAMAQEGEKNKNKDKIKEVETIVITNKGDNKEKVTIVIDGDNVTVNGKPVDEYKSDGLTIRKSKHKTPFAIANGGTWNLANGQNMFHFNDEDENRAMLGVVTEKTDDEKGVEITDITKDGGAQKAGLKEGDVILKINDKTIEDPDDLSDEIKKHKPGDKVIVTYLRDKKEQKAVAELSKWKGNSFYGFAPQDFQFNMPELESLTDRAYTIPRAFGQTAPRNRDGLSLWYDNRPRLGLSVQDTDEGKGVKVIEVDEDGNAAKAGIKEDDIITHINDKEVNSADEVAKMVKESKDKVSVRFQVKRDGKAQNIEVKIPRKLKTADL